MSLGDDYISTIKEWRPPKNVKQVEQFLGFVNYHRAFIKDLSKLATPLTELTQKKPWKWGADQQCSFEQLRHALQTAPVLTLPNKNDKFILDTDASDKAIGAELIQVQNEQERVVAYGSFTLSTAQRKYCTTRKELLAVVRFTQHFRHYLLGRKFILRTDHNSLRWLMNFWDPQGQLARWLEVLSQYDMSIAHRSGSKHVDADVLSRYQPEEPCREMSIHVDPKDLPCHGCTHCTKVHRSWAVFAREIDDTIPLGAGMVRQCSLTEPVDRKERDHLVRQFEEVQCQADAVECAVQKCITLQRSAQNVINSSATKRGYHQQMRQESESVRSRIHGLVYKLYEIPLHAGGVMQKFHEMLENQLRSSLRICEAILEKGLSRKLSHKYKSKQVKSRVSTLSLIPEEEETLQVEKPTWDPEALHSLFQLTVPTAEIEEQDPERYIEISGGKSVKVVTTRRKKELTQPKELVQLDSEIIWIIRSIER